MRKGTRSNSHKAAVNPETPSAPSMPVPLAPPSLPVAATPSFTFPPPPPPPAPVPEKPVAPPAPIIVPPPPVAMPVSVMHHAYGKGAKGFLPSGSSLAGVYSVGVPRKKVTARSIEDDTKFAGMLKPGELGLCEWRDAKKVAKVIDRSSSTSLEGVVTRRYYIHYLCFNRRMDEWVSEHKLVPYHDALTSAEQEDNDNVNGDGEPSLKKRKGGGEGNQYGVGEGETIHLIEPGHDEHEGMDEASIKEHEEVTKIKNINKIEIGRYIMDTWYFSPFPKEYYPDGVTDTMYFCEFCLKYYIHRAELTRHSSRCNLRHPPGNEIYRDGNIAMFEVDGGGSDKQHEYSQNLCYIAKLFLDHKTLYFDVDPFLFYVLCEISEKGFHLVGYYSKEKYSEQGFNLACILTLPCYQRKGYGSFLIDFSYMLSRKEEKIGSPEKPLSDLGLVSYRSYWCNRIMDLLEGLDKRRPEVSVWDVCKMTSFMPDDVTSTLKFLNLIKYNNGLHCLVVSPESMKFALTKFKRVLKQRTADIRKLHWTPLRLEAVKVDKWHIATYEETLCETDTGGL